MADDDDDDDDDDERLDHRDATVWEVYDLLRSAVLGELYHCHFLVIAERRATFIDISIAIAAPGSAIAGLVFFKTQNGRDVWQAFTAIAAVLGVIKPFLKLTSKIKQHEQAATGFRNLKADLTSLSLKIRRDEKYSRPLQLRFEAMLERKKQLDAHSPLANTDDKLVKRLEAKVNRQYPIAKFYIPPDPPEPPEPPKVPKPPKPPKPPKVA